MKKIELVAITVLIAASGAYFINTMGNKDTNITTKKDQQETVTTPAPSIKKVKPQPRRESKVDRAALPVEHGYADAAGKQINPETGERLPPPPPVGSPTIKRNSVKSTSARQHGHENAHSSHNHQRNAPPPPTGANG